MRQGPRGKNAWPEVQILDDLDECENPSEAAEKREGLILRPWLKIHDLVRWQHAAAIAGCGLARRENPEAFLRLPDASVTGLKRPGVLLWRPWQLCERVAVRPWTC